VAPAAEDRHLEHSHERKGSRRQCPAEACLRNACRR
jgi:hypothetical protein